jgi:transcriptional regulator with XRE-family HTH domain
VTAEQEIATAKADFARALGLNLQRLRLARGLSQERLAHMAGISGNTVHFYEKGEARPGAPMNARVFTLVALAQALSVTVVDLLPPEPTVPIVAGR